MKTYWGDIHSHCAASYGYGTPKRALENAKSHLDFCSITGHAFWPDMPMDLKTQNNVLIMHFGGFQKLQYFWKELMTELKAANKPGKFITLPSYEWHSMKYGDYNVYYNMNDAPLIDAPTLPELIKATSKYKAILLPHHCSYLSGFRGTRWKDFDSAVSPLVEIFSNHGCGESDDAYYDYYHTMGPRVKETSVREGLLQGHKFGFYASTDTHDGYPGHYGHGRIGVICDKLDRQNLWNAIQKRRTLASTGARFEVSAHLNGGFIGESVRTEKEMELKIDLTGTAPLELVELVEGFGKNCKLHRLPMPTLSTEFSSGKYKIKIECGWGRKNIVHNWDIDIKIKNGKLLDATQYCRFSSYEMEEEKATEKLSISKNTLNWKCRTKQNPAGLLGGTHFGAGGTQNLVIELDTSAKTELELKCGNSTIKTSIKKLVNGSCGKAVAGFCSPSLKIHRAVPEKEYSFNYETKFVPSGEKGFIYIRAKQTDGQMLWTSPIWRE
ncbi:MAG: hypothetical protein A2020_12975 [Lentisphaerae bacterium GWF2_45_14]|nr:MAG: hypothetical protein A2020_12975 [Lentisphaerae bacterium GWF2_45_14]